MRLATPQGLASLKNPGSTTGWCRITPHSLEWREISVTIYKHKLLSLAGLKTEDKKKKHPVQLLVLPFCSLHKLTWNYPNRGTLIMWVVCALIDSVYSLSATLYRCSWRMKQDLKTLSLGRKGTNLCVSYANKTIFPLLRVPLACPQSWLRTSLHF